MKTELLQVRIPIDLLEQVRKLAESNAISVSSMVRMIIKKGVDNA